MGLQIFLPLGSALFYISNHQDKFLDVKVEFVSDGTAQRWCLLLPTALVLVFSLCGKSFARSSEAFRLIVQLEGFVLCEEGYAFEFKADCFMQCQILCRRNMIWYVEVGYIAYGYNSGKHISPAGYLLLSWKTCVWHSGGLPPEQWEDIKDRSFLVLSIS